jgi:hypothetical protein
MVLIFLSVMVAAILVAISRIRNRMGFGGFTRSGITKEDFSIEDESAEQPAASSPVKPFLVVVLPDGTIVTPRVAGEV